MYLHNRIEGKVRYTILPSVEHYGTDPVLHVSEPINTPKTRVRMICVHRG